MNCLTLATTAFALASCTAAFTTSTAFATPVPIANASFEYPIDPPTTNTVLFDTLIETNTNVEGWNTSSGTGTVSGVFLNQRTLIGSDIFDPVSGVTGNHAAYIGLTNDVGRGKGFFSQVLLDSSSEAGAIYRLSFDVGFHLASQPLGTSPSLSVRLGDASGRVEYADLTINLSDLNADGALKGFSMESDALEDGFGIGEPLAIRLVQSGGSSGGFLIDDFRLEIVPEPTSLAMISLMSIGLIARRRR